MKQYISFFRISVMKGLQYRTAALAGIVTQFFFGFVFIMIFEAFYHNNPNQPIELTQVIQMIWLQQSFLIFIMLWFRDPELYNMITKGNIAYELCRPTSLYHYWYARLIGQRLSGAFLRSVPIIIFASLLPSPYTLYPPVSLTAGLLFAVATIFSLLIIVCISMFIYISIFYTKSPAGSFLFFSVFGEFFGGLPIPIPLMPKWLQIICYVLPFRYSGDLPFRIYTGHIHTEEALYSIGIQIFWILLMFLLGKLWMKKALKKVVVLGG